jgi:hypothetical protein
MTPAQLAEVNKVNAKRAKARRDANKAGMKDM